MLVTQSRPTQCDPVVCGPPGSSVHGILQARILEQVAMPSSRGSSRPRDRTWVSHIAGRFFTIWTTRETYEDEVEIVHGRQSRLERYSWPGIHPMLQVPAGSVTCSQKHPDNILHPAIEGPQELVTVTHPKCKRNSNLFKGWFWGFPGGLKVKNLPSNAGNMGSIPGLGRSDMPSS